MLNNNLWYVIYTALVLSALSSGILAFQKKEYRYFGLFSLLCIYIIWHEAYSLILLKRKERIQWLANIEIVIEFTILLIIQAIICKQKIIKQIIFVLAIFFVLFSFYRHLFVVIINKRDFIIYSLGAIAIILCCFYSLTQILLGLKDVPLQKQPNLLFTITIVFFHGTTFILNSSYSLLIGLPSVFLNNITTFLYISYAFTYFIHTWAFCTQIDFYKLHPKRWF
jgi:hypothetical protein